MNYKKKTRRKSVIFALFAVLVALVCCFSFFGNRKHKISAKADEASLNQFICALPQPYSLYFRSGDGNDYQFNPYSTMYIEVVDDRLNFIYCADGPYYTTYVVYPDAFDSTKTEWSSSQPFFGWRSANGTTDTNYFTLRYSINWKYITNYTFSYVYCCFNSAPTSNGLWINRVTYYFTYTKYSTIQNLEASNNPWFAIQNTSTSLCWFKNNTSVEFYTHNLMPWVDFSQNLDELSYERGYNIGIADGEDKGYETGKKDGYQVGYDDGFSVGASTNNSFLGLFTAVVDAPVQVFTNLLDVEILGYDMKQVALSLLSVALIISILRWFTKGG